MLNGEIGDYVTSVRKDRQRDDGLLCSLSEEIGRVLSVPLSFLNLRPMCIAVIYRDGDDMN